VERHQRHVVVLGGGISGLAAAYALAADVPRGTRITIVEASDRLGGKLRTEEFMGRPVDCGADAFLARVPAGVALAESLGLTASLISPATQTAYVYAGGRLRALPAGTSLGTPVRLASLAKSGVLSPFALVRAALEPLLPGAPLDRDIAIGDLIARRFGRQVRDRLVDPLLGGVYAGSARALSLDATSPDVARAAHASRSVLLGLRRVAPAPSSGPVFHSFAGGMSVIVDALADALHAADVTVRLRAQATELAQTSEGWRVRIGDERGISSTSGELRTDAVVIALPALPASRLLRGLADEAAAELAGIEYASVGIVTMAYPRPVVSVPGSGFLVGAREKRVIKACTWMSQKWPHLAGDVDIVRCSVGRAGDNDALRRDDGDLADAVHQDLRDIMGLRSLPVAYRVTRWGGALPQYAVGHLDRVRRIEASISAHAGLAVAGAAYRGVGIPACIESGQRAAALIAQQLRDGTIAADEGEHNDG
jgi:protoporphyrinogen/coproporphyrinogen III oxidase